MPSASLPTSGRIVCAMLVILLHTSGRGAQAGPLPGTQPLEEKGDLAAKMVEGIGKYLDRELAASVEKRKQFWKPDFSSTDSYRKSVQPNRERLKKILGVVDERVPFTDIEYVGGPITPSLVAETDKYKVHAVRWPVLPGVDGEGLLLEPKDKVIAQVVAIPDADWTPEQLVGLAPGVPKESQFARRLAENGCRVMVPVLIDRQDTFSGSAKLSRWTNQPHREFIYRMAYEMGRHIIGYEVQKVLAVVDWFTREQEHPPVGVFGYGEGGLLGLLSAALDERIQSTQVNGYFAQRERLWQEPIYRNVWGYLREFGDAEVGRLLYRRDLIIGSESEPEVRGPPASQKGRSGAAPGHIPSLELSDVPGEFRRMTHGHYAVGSNYLLYFQPEYRDKRDVNTFLAWLLNGKVEIKERPGEPPTDQRKQFDPAVRQKRQFDQLVTFTQKLWRDSDYTRQAFWQRAYSAWQHVKEPKPVNWEFGCDLEGYRKYFWEEVIGKLPDPDQPMNPRSRQIYDEPKWTGYEVTLDLYPDVFAYGILLLPKDLKEGEKRPVVVCQHGLEGRPTDVTNPKERTKYYNSFGAQLADLGYIVFAPQNPYIGQDKFRVLQRKANPLKLSLFSFIVRQHERILDWLATQPHVDPERIAFFGLSYGGKTAMRVPAILKKYCLSICSGDFNEWIGKNVSVDLRMSYMWSGEYEMYEWDLGNTFNYAEMAYLIAPRPFMVERGHDDGVGIDEMVAYEYAKVRYLYADKLKIPDRTAIEFFASGHEIHGKGTFAFLQKHLNWPAQKKTEGGGGKGE
jgi:dienelactone hydrolase